MLDIIIPVYKRQKGLRESLDSIGRNSEITITIVDDCSEEDYRPLIDRYPYCKYIFLDKNGGPGNARQCGMEHTSEPYIYFLDAGNIFLNLNQMLKDIKNNPKIKMFNFGSINEYGTQRRRDSDFTAGYVYAREFINQYNIHFCEKSSYANEDLGFIRLCRMILRDKYNFNDVYMNFYYAVVREDYNANSLTKKNHEEFPFKMCLRGTSLNVEHILNCGRENGVKEELLLKELKQGASEVLHYYDSTYRKRKEFFEQIKQDYNYFYKEVYLKYLPPNKEMEALL